MKSHVEFFRFRIPASIYLAMAGNRLRNGFRYQAAGQHAGQTEDFASSIASAPRI